MAFRAEGVAELKNMKESLLETRMPMESRANRRNSVDTVVRLEPID